eukprot:gene494-930_t
MNEEKLRKLVDFLHEKGLERYNLRLPEIAVMGDTSSCKSSLLSSLSGVQLPSASDLATRCPTRIHLEGTDDDTLSASIRTPVVFDVVEVDLKKLDSFDATLIDLPGFLRSVGKGEDPRIVSDIKDLCQLSG